MRSVYDDIDRVSSLRYLKSGGGVAYFDYGRDVMGRITKINREGGKAIYYNYDTLNRLTTETWLRKSNSSQAYAFRYDYDLSHNRTRMRRKFGAGVEWDSTYYTYDISDALKQRRVEPGALTRQYEVSPNAATYFEYGANQLVTKVTPPPGDGNPWTFSYDAQLNRYKIDRGGTVRYLLWDGLNVLEERDNANALVARYTYGQTPIYGIGSVVEIYQVASNKKYLLALDHRGTGHVLLDESGAEIVRRWYDAFGVILGETGSWPVDFGYQTNWMTVQIGNKMWGLSRYRVYDPTTGRFTVRDMLNSLGVLALNTTLHASLQELKNFYALYSFNDNQLRELRTQLIELTYVPREYASNSFNLNKYCYVNANPVMLVDPTGLGVVDNLLPYLLTAAIILLIIFMFKVGMVKEAILMIICIILVWLIVALGRAVLKAGKRQVIISNIRADMAANNRTSGTIAVPIDGDVKQDLNDVISQGYSLDIMVNAELEYKCVSKNGKRYIKWRLRAKAEVRGEGASQKGGITTKWQEYNDGEQQDGDPVEGLDEGESHLPQGFGGPMAALVRAAVTGSNMESSVNSALGYMH